MDKKSWLWKKKSSDKQAVEKGAATGLEASTTAVFDNSATLADKDKKDNHSKTMYVQVPIESYTHLTGLADQVKSFEEQAKILEDEVKELNEKLSEAHSEMTNKEQSVKQHAKVAEEAVSGWEKAEAEAEALKNNLESVTLLKLKAEDRASHLDGALKDYTRQIQNLKEEHDKKLHEVVVNKTKLFDNMKFGLEAKIANLDQELQRSAAEKAMLSRSLNERSSKLIKLSEEKSQAEAEKVVLKSTIESCEKEVNSLKYELHIAWKEADIRNEENNMSMHSAEVANKQHLEGVKKIAKLEAECQRLRGLVRKKLPGPAALAQMKLEVENLGRDCGESRLRRSIVTPTPQFSQLPEFTLENVQKYQKHNELLAERFLETEEEMKMLKEALTTRNSELQMSRSMYAQMASKLQSLEAQLQSYGNHKVPPRSNYQVDSPHKSENSSHLDLMDDFLEMEKLAYQSNGSNDTCPISDVSNITQNAGSELVKSETSLEVMKSKEQELLVSSNEDETVASPKKPADKIIFEKLQSKISMALESMTQEKDMEKVLGDIRQIMQDMHDILKHQLANGVVDLQANAEGCNITAKMDSTVSGEGKSYIAAGGTANKELENAISKIYYFVMILGKEIKSVPTTSDGDGLDSKLNLFSSKYSEPINREINLMDFVLDISRVLSEAGGLQFNLLGFNNAEMEPVTSDCIDKVALPENKVVCSSRELYENGCVHFPNSASDPDVPSDEKLVPLSESSATSWKCSLEEFDQLKMEKDNLIVDLARCTENFESTKAQLLEMEQLLADVKSQLTSAQKSNSLAETQLKCMAESYETLDARSEKLQTELKLLEAKIENLENELQEERRNHQDSLVRCQDLKEQLQSRVESCTTADNDDMTNQEELTAATEKLAECQETIFLLGKQLKALRPQTKFPSSPNRTRNIESSIEEETTINGMHLQEPKNYFSLHEAESKSSLDQPTKLEAFSASSTPNPGKHVRGFSRFFSSKEKNGSAF